MNSFTLLEPTMFKVDQIETTMSKSIRGTSKVAWNTISKSKLMQRHMAYLMIQRVSCITSTMPLPKIKKSQLLNQR